MKASGTYPMPKHGWTCFHCGENFGNPNLARAHFGPTPASQPACVLIQERGMLYELREHEARHSELLDRATRAEERADVLEQEMEEYRRAAKADSCHQLRMNIDGLEGRALAADSIIRALRARAPELINEVVG